MTAYRSAIDETRLAIERRGRYFRNQVVVVVLVGVLSSIWALLARSTPPLTGLALLVPICGAFFFADHRVVDHWRSRLLSGWVVRDLEITALRLALRSHPALPKATIEGMLATLPAAQDLTAEQRISTPTRRAIAASAVASFRSQSDTLALKTGAAALTGGALIGAVVLGRLEPLGILAGLVAVPVIGVSTRRRRSEESQRELVACRREPEFSEADYVRLAAPN
jgi:hypothetical protein